MNYIEKILDEISHVKEIVESWKNSDRIADIERKVVRDYLSRIYDELSAADFVSGKQKTEIITYTEIETEEVKGAAINEEEIKPAESVDEKNSADDTAIKITNTEDASQHQYAPAVLGEALQKSKRFLSDDFAENDVLLTPIKDLSKGIGLNDKFLFAKELFGGNAQQFVNAVTEINAMNSISDALEYIKCNFSWQEDSPVVKHFITLVRRRFM
ncbi:MAG: hypothetical protein LBK94_12690 [Prevotellaceae bacterium]|jgi:hypothetical protein|nr:hypothetical protein [Prevotellaceae bacterium]